jgi:glycosyltransferase involved in cell wall biosynthesis
MSKPTSAKVIHIPRRFTENSWGGTESMLIHLSRELIRAGQPSEIWTTTALDENPRSMISGTSVLRFPYFYPYFKLSREAKARLDLKGGNIFSFSLLVRLLFTKRPRLIHLHTGKRLGSIGRWVCRIRRIPYVISVHGGALETTQSEMQDFLEPTQGAYEWGKILGALFGSRRIFDDASGIHCVNASEARRFQERYPDKLVSFIANGVDSDQFASADRFRFREAHQIPKDGLLIGCISRIDRQKNQLLLVRAFEKIAELEPRAHLLIAGPITHAAYGDEVRALVEGSNYRSRIHLLGGLNPLTGETADGFRALDIFVLPSDHEPFGIAILEAWSAGCAVLASAVGGIPSFTTHQENVLHFTPGKQASLEEQLLKLVRERELRRQLSESGLKRVRQKFDWRSIAGQFLSFYQAAERVGPAE